LRLTLILTLALLGAFCVPQTAWAYIGPGAGMGAIATVIALIGAVLLAIVGFLWYPIKRLLRKNKKQSAESSEAPN